MQQNKLDAESIFIPNQPSANSFFTSKRFSHENEGCAKTNFAQIRFRRRIEFSAIWVFAQYQQQRQIVRRKF